MDIDHLVEEHSAERVFKSSAGSRSTIRIVLFERTPGAAGADDFEGAWLSR